MRRVAITGIGIVSCFGRGKEAAFDFLSHGRSGIRLLTGFDASALNCRIGGEVPADALAGPFSGDRFTRLAMLAAEEATTQAQYADAALPSHRIGTLIGTGLGGCETQDAAFKRLYGTNATRLPPTVIPWSMYNAATSAVAAKHHAEGPSFSIVSACSSSAHAIGQASQWIRSGAADMVLAGGSDAPLAFSVIRGWEGMRVLAIDNEHPDRACRPFSADRSGIVLAEGAAVFVLETFESAERRGQPILGEIAGFGMSSDAGHLTDPSSDGAARAMRSALEDGGLSPDEVQYINAHGTATRANDVTETRAIRSVFGEAADRIPVSSTKSMHGHAMGASGAIEIACSIVALSRGIIPPTINLDLPDPECDLDYVPNEARATDLRLFLSSSFGFGGMNAVVAVRVKC